jgi:shikimate 5-dehydrogenase
MDKNKLRNIIELVVRKEVKKQLSEIFINEEKEIKLSETISKPKPKRVINKPKKQYTKNKALNEVLNNTKPLGSQEQEDYPTLGGGVLGSDNMAEVLGYGDLGMGSNDERAREMGAVDTIKKAGVSVDQVPEDVQNALTRDYSGLMKAIDKKKKGEGNYRP